MKQAKESSRAIQFFARIINNDIHAFIYFFVCCLQPLCVQMYNTCLQNTYTLTHTVITINLPPARRIVTFNNATTVWCVFHSHCSISSRQSQTHGDC